MNGFNRVEFNRVEEEEIDRIYKFEKARRASQQISEHRMKTLKAEAIRRVDREEMNNREAKMHYDWGRPHGQR